MADDRIVSDEAQALMRIANALEQVNVFGDHVCVYKNAGLMTGVSRHTAIVVQACTCGKARQIKL